MSKDLFLAMREEQIATNNFLPTKGEIIESSANFAKKIINSGEFNLMEGYSQALRLKEAITEVEKRLKEALPQENTEAFGLTITYRNGGDTINYNDDEVVKDLEQRIKQRKELLKVALKSDEIIYDSDGIEVSKVSTTPRKSGLSVKC